jgi:hypothetical protein
MRADAAIVTFPNRIAFDATFPTALIENWDSFAVGTMFANGSTVNGITYNSSTGVATVDDSFFPTTPPNSLGRPNGGLFFFSDGDTMTFGFPTPIIAFGIDINTFETLPGGYTATTNLGDVAPSVFDPFPGLTTGQFIGFVSDTPFTSLTIAEVNDESYTLDTLRHVPAAVDGAIPEPYAFLVWAGLAACAAVYARRKF